jgi:hypothetical protein
LEPNASDVHIQMAFVLSALSEYEQAIQEFNTALKLGEQDRFFVSKKTDRVLDALEEVSRLSGKLTHPVKISETFPKFDKFGRNKKILGETKKHIDSPEISN